jgi:hypothetical protein
MSKSAYCQACKSNLQAFFLFLFTFLPKIDMQISNI